MKNRHLYLAVLAFLLAGLIGWRFFGVQPAPTMSLRVEQKSLPSSSASPTDIPKSSSSRPAPVNADAAVINAVAVQSRVQQFQQALDAENARPINYYGKVIDQYGEPVSEANVVGNVMLNVGLESSGYKTFTTTTDPAGLFQFTDLRGVNIGLSITKSGYEIGKYDLASNGPDKGGHSTPADRVVFRMWKLHGAEPMVHWQLNRIGLAVDGTASSFDLVAGKRADGTGDIAIRFTRTPLSIERGKPFDWVLTFQIPTGGFAEITGPYANEAPTNGYQPTITIAEPASAKDWTPSFEHAYFFTARNGQVFGRMTVHLVGDYVTPPTHFELEVYANPAGSRNLEFDAAKAYKPKQ
ncbi:hypothetical protein GALL_290010 [mine drainage metagenome]|uniref:Carboxypeptidase regulatory-like domain-containing protein n=1 Tax=mine drainage metagenome TaxID=410659 RepID=A0A1J5QZN0_9ZZZZ